MQWKVSSGLAAFTSLFLFVASDLVAAQITSPYCTDTISSWKWSFNSLGQNPCTVLAFLMATCYGGSFEIPPLGLGDTSYSGPFVDQVTATLTDACWCNTVTYNLISACSECQGGQSLFWSDYNFNCTLILAPSTFPNPVPAGTRVPQWALLGIPSSNYWSPTAAEHVGDTPEILPGELIDIL